MTLVDVDDVARSGLTATVAGAGESVGRRRLFLARIGRDGAPHEYRCEKNKSRFISKQKRNAPLAKRSKLRNQNASLLVFLMDIFQGISKLKPSSMLQMVILMEKKQR